jgi:hypothetical protein
MALSSHHRELHWNEFRCYKIEPSLPAGRLILSYDIVKANAGEIKVTTNENEGLHGGETETEFIIVLPR